MKVTAASFNLTLAGTVSKEMGVVEVIPQLAAVSGMPLIDWFNQRAKLIGSATPRMGLTTYFAQDDGGDLQFAEAVGSLGLDLKATLAVDVLPSRLTASGWVGGGGVFWLGVPEPFLRQVAAYLQAGVEFEIDALFTDRQPPASLVEVMAAVDVRYYVAPKKEMQK